ncbi:MAG: hypothetical protein K9G67_05260 [Bacteroidales bacterium]|nr:hypothetical protein [Bacteroidales bacterium]MCF8343273.1 hypothetical protein [Bacteroidales bacterium]MCF8350845.1 hypothetical protein [Bacteroidales bacterium]MCF8375742.1 hypothetical protein [Bacteroidales bacterium]MCF8400342.1 hypothetical protein [Bacteroidales bacterium]
MKIPYLIGICMLLIGSPLNAQTYGEEPRDNRFVYGGGFGLQFGTVTLIEVSPMIGYKVTERFVPGIGFSYTYYKDNRFEPDYETNIFGGSIFARYYVLTDLFAQAEYQKLSYERMYWPLLEKERISVDSYLIGGGYRQWIGRSFAATIIVLYNLNESLDSPYSNPIFRIGFQAGF